MAPVVEMYWAAQPLAVGMFPVAPELLLDSLACSASALHTAEVHSVEVACIAAVAVLVAVAEVATEGLVSLKHFQTDLADLTLAIVAVQA